MLSTDEDMSFGAFYSDDVFHHTPTSRWRLRADGDYRCCFWKAFWRSMNYMKTTTRIVFKWACSSLCVVSSLVLLLLVVGDAVVLDGGSDEIIVVAIINIVFTLIEISLHHRLLTVCTLQD